MLFFFSFQLWKRCSSLTYNNPESLSIPPFQVHSFQFLCEDIGEFPLSPLSPRSPFCPSRPGAPGAPGTHVMYVHIPVCPRLLQDGQDETGCKGEEQAMKSFFFISSDLGGF